MDSGNFLSLPNVGYMCICDARLTTVPEMGADLVPHC